MKYIVEHGIPGAVKGCETIEDIRRYLNTDPHPNHRLVSGSSICPVTLIWELDDKKERERALLLEACKRAYRKHVMDDPDIAWSELCESLGATLAEVMGDKEFGKWADKISSEKTV